MTLDAPAKLNISLEILGKRPDGYHELKTLMVKLPGLADRLTFTPAETFGFSCSDPSLPCDETNLVVKAARAFEATAKMAANFQIHLEKHVPHGAGLGGGSSDAATTLTGLNELLGTPLTDDQLAEIAASLGSDIVFFLTPGPSWCTGRGEIVRPADPVAALPVLLLKPAFAVSTQDAYGRFATGSEIPGISYAGQNLGEVTLRNDLERPVFAKHRFLAELKQWLLDHPGTSGAMMSGSGSTVFAILRNPEDAGEIAAAARAALDPSLWSWSGFTG